MSVDALVQILKIVAQSPQLAGMPTQLPTVPIDARTQLIDTRPNPDDRVTDGIDPWTRVCITGIGHHRPRNRFSGRSVDTSDSRCPGC
jgi:hypothetical protein